MCNIGKFYYACIAIIRINRYQPKCGATPDMYAASENRSLSCSYCYEAVCDVATWGKIKSKKTFSWI